MSLGVQELVEIRTKYVRLNSSHSARLTWLTRPVRFARLVAVACGVAKRAGVPITREGVMVDVALLLLEPVPDELPTRAIRARVRRALRRHEPLGKARRAHIPDLMIAYGCGVGRTIPRHAYGWEARWDPAMVLLMEMIKIFVHRANDWMNLTLKLPFGLGFWRILFPDPKAIAMTLAEQIVNGFARRDLAAGSVIEIECDGVETFVSVVTHPPLHPWELPHGARLVFETGNAITVDVSGELLLLPALTRVIVHACYHETAVRFVAPGLDRTIRFGAGDRLTLAGLTFINVWDCHCGTVHCAERHRLSAWRPSLCTLLDFVASATKGPKRKGAKARYLSTRTFLESMYVVHLVWGTQAPGNARIIEGPVEFTECATPGCHTQAVPNRPTQYEGPVCPVCGIAFNPRTTRRLKRPLLIVLIGTGAAIYTPEWRACCPACRNLFVITHAMVTQFGWCAHCHTWLGDGPDPGRIPPGARSYWSIARMIERGRRRHAHCPGCHAPLPPARWCPLCDATNHTGAATYLPLRETMVWCRVLGAGPLPRATPPPPPPRLMPSPPAVEDEAAGGPDENEEQEDQDDQLEDEEPNEDE